MVVFDYERFLPRALFEQVNETKTYAAGLIRQELAGRAKRADWPRRLVLAAADHNARMITAYQGEELALANRHEYLARLLRLMCAGVDGIEGTPDILEDVALLNYLIKNAGGPDLLSGKLLIGTVNRGGLKGCVWELDDFCSAYTAEQAAALGLDALKYMLRIDPSSPLSKNNLAYCVDTVNQAARYDLPVFIEVLLVEQGEAGLRIRSDLPSLVKSVSVVSSLGVSSARKWLEVPVCSAYGRMADATTCSILVVPDEREQSALAVVEEYSEQMNSAGQVRGILLGRNVMYNQSCDPYLLAEAISILWHQEGQRSLCAAEAYEAARLRQVCDCVI